MIQIEVRSTEAVIRDQEPLTVGLTGAKVQFSFGPEWDGLIKTAVFRQGDKTVAVADIHQEATIPWEVLTQEGEPVQIGVYGIDTQGAVAIPTVWEQTQPVCPGADPNADPSAEPTPGLWEQMLGKVSHLETALEGVAAPVKVSVTQRADGSYEADHYCMELLEAYNSGRTLYCQFGNRVLSLGLATKVQMVFIGVFTGQLYSISIGNLSVTMTTVPLNAGETKSVPRVEISDSVATIEPNKFYVFPEMESLEIILGGAVDPAAVQEYKFRFTSGATATTLILPESVKGDISVSANSVVELSIVDGYAVTQSWAVS